MSLSIALNVGFMYKAGELARQSTNQQLKIRQLEQEKAQLIRDSDDAISYLIEQCRAMIRACNGGR